MKCYDNELRTQRIKRDWSYKIAVILSTGTSWSRYKWERNKYTFIMRTKKKLFIERKLSDAFGDTKQTWRILKQLINGKQSSVEINDVKESSSILIGEKLNKFFIESVEEINRSIEAPYELNGLAHNE